MKRLFVLLFFLIAPVHAAELDDKLGTVDWSVFNDTLASSQWRDSVNSLRGGGADASSLLVEMDLVNVELHPGDSKAYSVKIKNTDANERTADVSFSGKMSEFIDIRKTTVNIQSGTEEKIDFRVDIPMGASIGVYLGEIIVKSSDYIKRIPSSITIIPSEEPRIDVRTEVLTKEIEPGEPLTFLVDFNNIGGTDFVNVTYEYAIINVETEEVVTSGSGSDILYTTLTNTKNIQFPEGTGAGRYAVETVAAYSGKKTTSSDFFEIIMPIPWGLIIGIFGMSLVGLGGVKTKQRYERIKKEKERYISPLQYAKLPEEKDSSFFIGRIAESKNRTYIDSNDLLTHMLVAGGTGFGKTVAAMDIIEGVLLKKIPVIVFDPTLQWTGFLKKCKDERMLSLYPDFGMDPEDARSFKGSIIEMDNPTEEIDLDTYMRAGEITVFALGKLETKKLDQAVQNIINCISKHNNKESSELRCVLVFDEVHRLLPKYGGVKGYEAVEKAIREFRRYGLGVILISQVLSDFRANIHGNIGTEIQMKTKYDGDLQRVEKKYGEEYAQTLVKEVVGVGMVHNSKYNNGKPYFVHFRPLLHSTERIPDEELAEHNEFVKALTTIEKQVKALKARGLDTYEFELEMNLAKDKLKQGYASMARIYIESAQEKIKAANGG